MKTSIISIIVTIFIASTAFAQSGKITVYISGIKKTKGQLVIGLYNNKNTFPKLNKAYKSVFLNVNRDNIKYIFSDVPNGDYAIAVFHDKNSDGKLDRDLLGIPEEGYGFSNNVLGTDRPPHFDKAKFKLDGSYTSKIKMKR
ncbi:MAG: DUF2141 domain-containing protein [bacterium]|nr:DUF2141 domain-containing protein [bacterium]